MKQRSIAFLIVLGVFVWGLASVAVVASPVIALGYYAAKAYRVT